MRHSIRFGSLVSVMSLAIYAAPAVGAVVTKIHYDVLSGWFNGVPPGAVGPIMGGTIDWTPPGGIVTTPALGVTGGKWTIKLTGPTGYFRIQGTGGFATITPNFFTGNPTGIQAYSGMSKSLPYPTVLSIYRLITGRNSPYSGNGQLRGMSYFGQQFDHFINIGNEVRSGPQGVPSMSPLGGLALGLALVAIVAGAHSRARGRQRA